ncbi:annexin-2 receptor [Mustela nigripes]|uniref:annexin-2 receptor n=1 Tax=Mustela nigripes TaxID=77151 RepID=UPI002814BE41|nr:annexin-2 receptor [Mustela nigripes]
MEQSPAMEQSLPRCVRQAWDSAEHMPGPRTLPALSPEDCGPWPLPLYPKLGQLSGDDEDFNQELLCNPCGLLSPHCPRHRPRSRSLGSKDRNLQPRSQSPTTGSPEEPGGRALRRPPPQPFPGLPEDSSERRLPTVQRSRPRLSNAAWVRSHPLWPGSLALAAAAAAAAARRERREPPRFLCEHSVR